MVAKMCKVETVMTNTSLLAPDVAEAAAGAQDMTAAAS